MPHDLVLPGDLQPAEEAGQDGLCVEDEVLVAEGEAAMPSHWLAKLVHSKNVGEVNSLKPTNSSTLKQTIRDMTVNST